MERRSRGAVIESIELPVEVIDDNAPGAISAGQWAKGATPVSRCALLTVIRTAALSSFFSEAIDDTQSPGFQVGEKVAGGALVQRGERLLAYLLNGPLGMESNLTGDLTNLVDRAGNVAASVNVDVSLDADRGVGAQVRGQVVDPQGAVVSPLPSSTITAVCFARCAITERASSLRCGSVAILRISTVTPSTMCCRMRMTACHISR